MRVQKVPPSAKDPKPRVTKAQRVGNGRQADLTTS